jgi:DNA-binding protein YbaB
VESSDEWLQRVQAESAARLEQVAAMQEELGRVIGRARSQQGEVKVAVNPAGAPLELDLSPSAMNLAPEELSAMILTTLQQAAAEAAERVRAVVAPVMEGADVDALLHGQVPPSTRQEVESELARVEREREEGR